MVGYYSFTIPAYSDATLYGSIFIDWIYSLISDSFVENKAIIDTRPDWAFGDKSEEEVFIKGMTFKYKNTEFVISTSKSSSESDVYIYIYARNNSGKVRRKTNYIVHNYSSDKTIAYLIGQNNDYFIISHYNNNSGYYYHFMVIKVDSPVNPADTDLYVSITDTNTGTYNKSFDGEDVNNVNMPVRFTLGTLIDDYDSSFLINHYNKKTELNNVYVYTPVHGIRGKISNLISLTRGRSTTLGRFYMVNGVEYVGLNSLCDIISSQHRGILLKSY